MLVPLFDRKDGTGADWDLMQESLFRAGFLIADSRPASEAQRSLMRRVHAGSYNRISDDLEPSKTGSPESVLPPSNTGVLKSSRPRPPR